MVSQSTFSFKIDRCAIALDLSLSAGLAANAAAVLALTAGARYPQLVGEALLDQTGRSVPGLIPIGIPVLAASALDLRSAWTAADAVDVDAIVLPAEAQKTTNYRALGETLSRQLASDWPLHGLLLVGATKSVRGLTTGFKLWGRS